ncbi:MAG: hypothetical protein H6698_08230 [Myxococcales bacterium]|nr:hypothetical protein [Myxococcales bacterium]MCB9531133.1 hypothetical protein [Myxococcales bacterium]MCB9534276.1 hypothetical protein [Myxococcales bacterium]
MRDPRTTHAARLRHVALAAPLLALVAGCADDSVAGAPRGAGGGTPVWDGPVGDNGLFTFTPADPGAAPGLYVVATLDDGTTFTSGQAEVGLEQYPVEEVARTSFDKSVGPGSGPSLFDDPGVLAAPARDVRRVQPTAYELALDGGFSRAVPPELRAEARFSALADQIAAMPQDRRKTIDCPGSFGPTSVHSSIGTFDGRSGWLTQQFGIETFGRTRGYAWAIHLAPEGVYLSLQQSDGIAFIPNSYGFGIANSVGYSRESEPGEVNGIATSVFPISGPEGRQVSLAYSIAEFWQFGFTIGLNDNGSLQRAIQFDTGWNVAANLGMPLSSALISIAFPVSIGAGTGTVISENGGEKVYVFVHGWTGPCADVDRVRGPAAKSADDGAAFFEAVSDSIALAADPHATEYADVMRDAFAAALGPAFESWAVAGGAPPAEGIAAETNAALLQDFIGSSSPTLCDTCADSTLDGFLSDTLVRFRVAGDDQYGLMLAAVESAAHYQRVLPQPARVAVDAAASAGAVDVASAYLFDQIADVLGTPDRYVADEVVRIEARAGEPTRVTVTAQEIADLLGVPVADVDGATVCIGSDFAGPRTDEACAQLSGDSIGGDITLRQSTRILLRIRVDLSTAAGFDADTVAGWEVNAAMRYVVAVPGPATSVELAAPFTAWSGAPVTLTASLLDEHGNFADQPATFTYFDHAGRLLGTVRSDDGQATLQYVLRPATPVLSTVEAASFELASGAVVEGWSLQGAGLSRDAAVLANGVDVTSLGWQVGALDSTELALIRAPSSDGVEAPALPAGFAAAVVNPGGLRSGRVAASRSPGGSP